MHQYSTCLWRGRFCMILTDGQWAMSRVGAYYDFDFSKSEPNSDGPVAGHFQATMVHLDPELDRERRTTVALFPLSDEYLIAKQKSGDFFLFIGDPNKGGRVQSLTMFR